MIKGLINQAFLHVDSIGRRVSKGHYDILNEERKIVLPQVLETMIQPGCCLTIRLWTTPDPQEDEAALHKARAQPQDEKNKPILFKDAVGRIFTFPFHLGATWAVRTIHCC
jgi:hypothetical protein